MGIDMKKQDFLLANEAVANVHIPRWNELPEFELYMDQVIGLAEKHLGALYHTDGKGLLTPSMINNYVKSGVLPPPKNKKYNRTHLAILMIICAMKPVMEISAISDVIGRTTSSMDIERVLDEFARMYENELSTSMKRARILAETSEDKEILSFIAIENTLRAGAARIVAMQAYGVIKSESESETKAEKPEKPEKKPQPKKKAESPSPKQKPEEVTSEKSDKIE